VTIFLLANFRHLKANVDEPFVFLTQMQQVFYVEDSGAPWWKIVLHKELRSKHVVAENNEEVSTLANNVISTKVTLQILEAPSHNTFVGAIQLTGANTILTIQGLQKPSANEEEVMG